MAVDLLKVTELARGRPRILILTGLTSKPGLIKNIILYEIQERSIQDSIKGKL